MIDNGENSYIQRRKMKTSRGKEKEFNMLVTINLSNKKWPIKNKNFRVELITYIRSERKTIAIRKAIYWKRRKLKNKWKEIYPASPNTNVECISRDKASVFNFKKIFDYYL